MHDWKAKFFEYGHTSEYVYSMNYWEYINITESFARMADRQSSGKKFSAGGKTSMHQKMIDNLKAGK